MTKKLRVGYVPLTDAALLHVAKAKHFAAARGLDLELIRESSWANIRDKLILGHFEAAHMLAPAAIASSIGIGQMETRLVAPVALGLNGNAITVSGALFDALRQEAEGDFADPRLTAKALARIVAKRQQKGEPALTFGHVFPFSSHHYQLRLWMRAGGVDPDEDVRLVVAPPPFMVETLRKGHVDGFCVGAPWNSLAVAAGVGIILHTGPALVRDCPEKVLAFRADWAESNAADVRALAEAVGEASMWATDAANRKALAALLASVSEPGVSAETIAHILEDPIAASGPVVAAAGLRLDPAAIKAHRSHALWLFAQMVAAGQVAYSPALADAAARVYRPDLGPEILEPIDAPRAFDGPAFSPDDLPAYLAALRGPPRG
ncbi:CmpA/NrtA family ABC transporter substrate-binding protein [Methylocapsa polymorpha]|uniref:CmpA/NrtA family ABC transporter substrate-binding protein n=1 Tax=Methylocapsa polymorpha TaxID=3080828 RepID=A0ABZ0HWV6_9HYPH|nr:CmpA/NrtA family ABC transporter substrate-binding protein [Methylocapsa sp. RX1]